MELSLCMIVRNEETVLSRCLDSVKRAMDEIVVVDTGSTDRTAEIAAAYTPLVFSFPWVDDFAAARNFAFSKASKPYLMWLDADDVMAPAAVDALLALKEKLAPGVDMVMMPYHVAFDHAGNPVLTYERERVVRRGAGFQWVGAIHEVIPPAGNILHADIPVLHKKEGPGDPDRNLRIFEKMIARGGPLSPREEFYFARELKYHGRFPEAASRLERFLDTGLGWLENTLSACRDLAECYLAMGKKREALTALLNSFRYDVPRAETCCEIGKYFFDQEQYAVAAFWYALAASGNLPVPAGGFVQPDCYGYIPYMQLCVCHHRMGDTEKAAAYNELAGKIKPEDSGYLYNKAFFASLLQDTEGKTHL